MKYLSIIWIVLLLLKPTDMTFYDFELKGIDGKKVDLNAYKGKKVLVVNVASRCGYTPQYEDLQQLHEQFGNKLVVLGFPANDFGGQEPGSNEDIVEFCQTNYGVSFQLFEKISVTDDVFYQEHHVARNLRFISVPAGRRSADS